MKTSNFPTVGIAVVLAFDDSSIAVAYSARSKVDNLSATTASTHPIAALCFKPSGAAATWANDLSLLVHLHPPFCAVLTGAGLIRSARYFLRSSSARSFIWLDIRHDRPQPLHVPDMQVVVSSTVIVRVVILRIAVCQDILNGV